jgi:hypothetical protein
MEAIYRSANPDLFFKFRDFKPDTGTMDSQAETISVIISKTLRACCRAFIGLSDASRAPPDEAPAQRPARHVRRMMTQPGAS